MYNPALPPAVCKPISIAHNTAVTEVSTTKKIATALKTLAQTLSLKNAKCCNTVVFCLINKMSRNGARTCWHRKMVPNLGLR